MYKTLPENISGIYLEKYLVAVINLRFITKNVHFAHDLRGAYRINI